MKFLHVAIIVATLAGAGILVKSAFKPKPNENPFPRESRAYMPKLEFAKRVDAIPDFGRKLRAVAANSAAPSDPAAQGFEIAHNGLKRVDDAVLDRRLDLMIKLVEHVDLPTCAAMARADAAGAKKLAPKILRALENLPAEDIRAFFDLTTKAVEAELNAKPVSSIARSSGDAAMRNLGERFSDDERALLMRVVGYPNTVSDSSACWLIKTVFAEIKDMPAKERYTVSRMLTQAGDGGAR